MCSKVQADSLLIYNTIITTIQIKIIFIIHSVGVNPIEMAVSLLAPHTCIVCKREGAALCIDCAVHKLTPLLPRCYRCGKAKDSPEICANCKPSSALRQVWLGVAYKDTAKEAIALLKFSRSKAMADSLAEWLNGYLPELTGDTLVSHAPTAYSRIRMRGYDQAQLIAKSFARKRQLHYIEVLRRTTTTRQVGASRVERFKQLHNAFAVRNPERLAGRHILLVDDVLTTGATLESAAKTLAVAGVKAIDAVVVAHALTEVSSSSTRNVQG